MKQTNDNLTIIDDLKKEIQCLKNILNREGISYQEELDQLKNSANAETIETNQGSRIVFPNDSQKIWQIDFLYVFGVVQTYTQKE